MLLAWEYLKLGQPSNTLSGGEAQRLKIISRAKQKQMGRHCICDEPTTGLLFGWMYKVDGYYFA